MPTAAVPLSATVLPAACVAAVWPRRSRPGSQALLQLGFFLPQACPLRSCLRAGLPAAHAASLRPGRLKRGRITTIEPWLSSGRMTLTPHPRASASCFYMLPALCCAHHVAHPCCMAPSTPASLARCGRPLCFCYSTCPFPCPPASTSLQPHSWHPEGRCHLCKEGLQQRWCCRADCWVVRTLLAQQGNWKLKGGGWNLSREGQGSLSYSWQMLWRASRRRASACCQTTLTLPLGRPFSYNYRLLLSGGPTGLKNWQGPNTTGCAVQHRCRFARHACICLGICC